MPVAHSVIGYVPDSIAKDLHEGRGFHKEMLELPLEPGKRVGHLRVRRNDIAEVRVGPSHGGHTSLQLILNPEASYEMVVTSPSDAEFATPIRDPSYIYGLGGRIGPIVIYWGPIYRQLDPGVFRAVEITKPQG